MNVLIMIVTFFASVALGEELSPQAELETVNGTLIIASTSGNPIYVHNNDRASQRFSPASTFKILNTLIGLDTNAVESSDFRFQWDGQDRGLATWNRDHNLQSAYRVSCVWCYQEIARKVGRQHYSQALEDIAYGNAEVGDRVDLFWLDGSLKISAFEQIAFLSQLYSGALPFSEAHFEELKEIMLEDKGPGYSLYAKGGWTGPQLHIGWYVGYVESLKGSWLFAMNMDMFELKDAPLRKQLVTDVLKELELI